MDPIKNFTPRSQQVLALSAKEAIELRHTYIGTEHLLLAIIRLRVGMAINVLKYFGIDLDMLKNSIESKIGIGPELKMGFQNIPYNSSVKSVLTYAAKESENLKHNYIGTEHLLLGIIREGEGIASRILHALDIDIYKCRNAVLHELENNAINDITNRENIIFTTKNTNHNVSEEYNSHSSEKNYKTKSILDLFGQNLNKLIKKKTFDPFIGREVEINRLVNVLSRRRKNNPVLIGEAGVGKTAVVEGLTQKIVQGHVPQDLKDKIIFNLDVASLLAGSKYRGEFEDRLKSIIKELKRNGGKIILFIDELHTIIGTGSAEGSMDISNILKPSLARGDFQCIGATTFAEYRKYIEKDAALERRFQSIKINAPSIKQSIHILKGIFHKYEKHHGVKYTKASLDAAVHLSDRYITSRFLPDKAIDVLDEAGAKVKINSLMHYPKIEAIDIKINQINISKKDSIKKQDFESAAKFRDEEFKLIEEKKYIIDNIKKNKKDSIVEVEDIKETISSLTGIPINQIQENDRKNLINLENILNKTIIGQDNAISAVSKVIRRSKSNLGDPNKPIGSFLFLGPTGVGKTYLATVLSEYIFGNKSIIQLNMSEYMEKYSVSKIIGSPPGYIGYEEGGQLTEKIRLNPYSLILFDEIEKACSDVTQLLLQILEYGNLTDSFGRIINFKNTIIIMTSNLGAEFINKDFSYLGFSSNLNLAKNNTIKSQVLNEAKKFFKPEFINRIDKIITFNKLNKHQIIKIIEIELNKLIIHLSSININVVIDDSVINFIANKIYNDDDNETQESSSYYGARPIKRAISDNIKDFLSDLILKKEIKEFDSIKIYYKDDILCFDFEKEANNSILN